MKDSNRPSTPLPEQGGFNERLDSILTDYASKYFQLLRTNAPRELEERHRSEAKAAIRTLVLEEIIEHDPANRFNCVALRAEMREKLEDTHDTK